MLLLLLLLLSLFIFTNVGTEIFDVSQNFRFPYLQKDKSSYQMTPCFLILFNVFLYVIKKGVWGSIFGKHFASSKNVKKVLRYVRRPKLAVLGRIKNHRSSNNISKNRKTKKSPNLFCRIFDPIRPRF